MQSYNVQSSGGPAVVYVTEDQPAGSRYGRHYRGRCAVALGAAQLILTVLMIVVIAVIWVYDAKVNTYEYIPIYAIGASILGGISTIFFCITGGINICSGKSKTTCLMISTLVLCIICLVIFCTSWFAFYLAQLFVYDGKICEDGYYGKGCKENTGAIAAFAIGVVVCIAFSAVTLASSIIVCMALCKGSSDEQQTEQGLLQKAPPSHTANIEDPPAKQ